MFDLHDMFQDRVACARYRAERDALAQRMEEVASEIDRTLSGVEGIEDAPAMRWARDLRAALGSMHSPRRDFADKVKHLESENDELREMLNDIARRLGLEGEIDYHSDYDYAECQKYVMDELDKRLMPEGMEWLLEVWPKWSNGEYCKFGDWWKADEYSEREPSRLTKLSIYSPEQLREWEQDEGENYGYEWNFMRPANTTYRPNKVEPPAPKVLDADGAEIRAGDTVWHLQGEEPWEWTVLKPYDEYDGIQTVLVTSHDVTGHARPENLTHRAPVLAADGKPLREGEHVWHVETGTELVVKELPNPGEYQAVVVFAPPASHLTSFDPDQLTHERPDSWERLEEDAGKNPFDYCKHVGHRLDTCENSEAYKARDLVRRAKALAGVSER